MGDDTIDVTFSDMAAHVCSLARAVVTTEMNDGKPIKIVTFARGGMPLATAVAHTLNIEAKDIFVLTQPSIFTLTDELWERRAGIQPFHLLFVDDLFDTSATAEFADAIASDVHQVFHNMGQSHMIAPLSRWPMSARDTFERKGKYITFHAAQVLNDSRYVIFEWEAH